MDPPTKLTYDLRPYQKQALYWMTESEKGIDVEKAEETFHPCWEHIKGNCNLCEYFYFTRYQVKFRRRKEGKTAQTISPTTGRKVGLTNNVTVSFWTLSFHGNYVLEVCALLFVYIFLILHKLMVIYSPVNTVFGLTSVVFNRLSGSSNSNSIGRFGSSIEKERKRREELQQHVQAL